MNWRLLVFGFLFGLQCTNAFHGHHRIRKQHKSSLKEMEEHLEEEEEEDEEDDDEAYTVEGLSTSTHFSKDRIFEQGETRDFLHFLRRIKYDHSQLPPGETVHDPVKVFVSVVVSNIRAVSEVTMDYNLEMFYREFWTDPRLNYDRSKFHNKSELALHESYANFLWHPDTFIPNALASKNPRKQSISHRSLLRLQADGQVLYSRRISVLAECSMDLSLFPFDQQICKLGIESYGYTADQVTYLWSHSHRKALQLNQIRLPDFKIKEAFVTQMVESYATGNYSRLYICFVFNRSAGFCFLQLIIPSTAVVITSWVSLWMENESSFQDMISIILTITFLLFSYNEVMPRVSYLKALDIWLAVCFMIVFLSLIKLAIIKYMKQRLKIAQDTSLAAGMIPLLQMSQITNSCHSTINNNNNDASNSNIVMTSPPSSPIRATHCPYSPPTQMAIGVDRRMETEKRRFNGDIYLDIDGSPEIRSTRRRKRKGFVEFCESFGHINFSAQTMRRFHWITQMLFFFGFVLFCLFFFLVYPSLSSWAPIRDPCCIRENAEWFANL
ncbi:unnamed protein product [Bursaphelenchus xylophilus]|uniref:(pine wood nematode) hypothetical protein n=1 Tax=Bursaphelenchus xylophilus TaxID=6326 RepID=A0A1I7SWQ3_BURXY|nr:unnamed protein product [Bursaphelenchus xylophilus]CAG9099797.1 unnamed protein product [Bursaphelenchus xylophilus]